MILKSAAFHKNRLHYEDPDTCINHLHISWQFPILKNRMQTTATEITSTLTTLRDYIRWASSQFTQAQVSFGQGTVAALDEAVALVLHTLHQPYNLSEAYFDCVLTLTERQAVFDIVKTQRSVSPLL